MRDFSAVKNAPEISFIDGRSVDDVRQEMVADYEAFMSKATGQPISLDRASPHRMELYAAAAQIYHGLQYVDRAGKQNLLKYSYSEWLDNVAIFKGVTRLQAKKAATTLRFTLSAERAEATGIPKGTRVTLPSKSVYFETAEYSEIPAGQISVDVSATCKTEGTAGNGLTPGELNIIVDPVPYMDSVENITETAGGAEIESDENLAERAFLAPSAYSTAGPGDAYLYWVKEYSAAIGDVKVNSDQQAGTVDIYFLMENGDAPGEEMINGLREYLENGDMRPMNDQVNVAAPAEVPYTINFKYWINQSDMARAVTIQAAVAAAAEQYAAWQRAIGRDINPSKLVAMVIGAGAKRVEITAPLFTPVGGASVSRLEGAPIINYGGLEND